jgi:hypothetical protein
MPFVAVAAVAAVGSIYSQNQSRKATKEAMRAEQRRAEVQNIREVRSQVRSARLAQAAINNAGAISNTLGSSGVEGGIASLGSQLQGNLGYMSDIARENTTIFGSSLKAAQHSSNAAMWGTIGQAASMGYGMKQAARTNAPAPKPSGSAFPPLG